MTKVPRATLREWRQYTALSLLCLGAVGVLELASGGAYFRPFFGNLNPLLVLLTAVVVGAISLGFLHSRGWFEINPQREALNGTAVSAGLATLLAIPVIVVDFSVGIEVVNVPPPWSLLFYPAIALVVEVFFHTLPLALFLAILGPFLEKSNPRALIWGCIVVVSFLEPTFQLLSGLATQSLSWLEVYIWLQVCAINLLQLYVFRRFGFPSMYSFRLVYYFYWHIVWGYLRLHLPF